MTLNLPDKLNAAQKELLADWKLLGWDEAMPDELEKAIQKLGVPEKKRKQLKTEQSERIFREAETVLKSLYYPSSIIQQTCKQCKRTFGTNYRYTKHCSSECLQESLKDMGLEWDPTKTDEERFKGEPPGVIKPEALGRLKKWAQAILDYESTPQEVPATHQVQQEVQDPEPEDQSETELKPNPAEMIQVLPVPESKPDQDPSESDFLTFELDLSFLSNLHIDP